MKPVLCILSGAFLFLLLGWTWSELPHPSSQLLPVWSNSYKLYARAHAIWLDRYDAMGTNLPLLQKTLQAAAKAKQIPELVIYAIPLRDLGQASEGGFASYEDYWADNQKNAALMAQFHQATGISPIVYLEPDSLPLAVQYRRDEDNSPEAIGIYTDRVRILRKLISLYQQAGAKVYLEAGHSGWFDYGDEDIQRIAQALIEANIAQADGLATNVSNRQPVAQEAHYLRRLLPHLKQPKLDIRVDTSRNGGKTQARQYYLHPKGLLIDNETPTGRWVGHWQPDAQGTILLKPFFGKPRTLARLTGKEKYTYDARRNVLIAPAWLDAVGDVKLGPAPSDAPPAAVSDVIRHFRDIKPPDDCDGALNCPPGASKQSIWQETNNRQAQQSWTLPKGLWTPTPS
jgi:hypothetical protein